MTNYSFNLGYSDFFKQHTLLDCPFLDGTKDKIEYYRGWIAGQVDWEASCEGLV